MLDYTIINKIEDGVIILIDNGDTQYLTNDDYEKFKKRRAEIKYTEEMIADIKNCKSFNAYLDEDSLVNYLKREIREKKLKRINDSK